MLIILILILIKFNLPQILPDEAFYSNTNPIGYGGNFLCTNKI